MSRMNMRSYLKPPLPKSPIRLRSRHTNSSLQTPSVSVRKFQNPGRDSDLDSKLAPLDYNSIANEIHSLAKKMKDEISEEEQENKKPKGGSTISTLESLACNSAPVMFERGRFYEQYSVKRNERLKRKKKGEEEDAVVVKETPYKLGVNHESMMSTKRKATAKKKTVSMVETTAMMPRYSLRSSSRKPPVIPMDVSVSAMKSVTTRRGRRI